MLNDFEHPNTILLCQLWRNLACSLPCQLFKHCMLLNDLQQCFRCNRTRDVTETRETRDLKKFLGIENFISHVREFQAAGPHARSFSDRR